MKRGNGILVLALAGALAWATGCSKSTSAVGPTPDPAPVPNTPANTGHLVEYQWNRLDPGYTELLTEDFEFVFAAGDSAGNRWRGMPWTREIESIAIQRMFDRAASDPYLGELSFDLDRTMIALPDPRPGKDPRFHRTVRTHVDVDAGLLAGGVTDRWIIRGNALLFFVRGDSAAIPHDMIERGFGPDSTRWWLQRWEDETLPEALPGLHPTPVRLFTLGQLKSRFVPLIRL